MSMRQHGTRRVYKLVKLYYAKINGKQVMCVKGKGELGDVVFKDPADIEFLPPDHFIA